MNPPRAKLLGFALNELGEVVAYVVEVIHPSGQPEFHLLKREADGKWKFGIVRNQKFAEEWLTKQGPTHVFYYA